MVNPWAKGRPLGLLTMGYHGDRQTNLTIVFPVRGAGENDLTSALSLMRALWRAREEQDP